MSYKEGLIKGDEKEVTDLYGERTVATSCQYFVSHIKPTSKILDVGCGPGAITADLAKLAPAGKTIGIDNNEGIIATASATFPPSSNPNLSYAVGDCNKLNYPDNAFDIVHAHALLVHLPDPVPALKEMHRVCKTGGIVVCREANPAIVVSLKPDLSSIRNYWERALMMMGKMGTHAEAGRKLPDWAKEAGFEKVEVSTSKQWNSSQLNRTVGEPAEQAVKFGVCTKEECEDWSRGWKKWEETEGHEFVFEAGEIICWK